MTKNIGLWIDHKKAILVIQSEQGENIQKIESGVGRHIPIGEHPIQGLLTAPNINREMINWTINSPNTSINFTTRSLPISARRRRS